MAHFLEADVQPWAAVLARTFFAPTLAAAEASQQASPLTSQTQAGEEQAGSSADGLQDAWRRLDELAPLGGAVDAVLRAWRLPLLKQLPLAPAAWHPALLHSHITAGQLELSCAAAVSCDAMHALSDVHTVTLDLEESTADGSDAEVMAHRVRSALASLRTLRSLTFRGGGHYAAMELCAPALGPLASLTSLDLSDSNLSGGVVQALAPALSLSLIHISEPTRPY